MENKTELKFGDEVQVRFDGVFVAAKFVSYPIDRTPDERGALPDCLVCINGRLQDISGKCVYPVKKVDLLSLKTNEPA